MSDTTQKSMEFARELQVKFEMYFTGLIFTLLAASIQTAKFTSTPLQNACELAGWAFLLVAGLAGLSRLEWMPNSHDTHARVSRAEETIKAWRAAQASGRAIVNEQMEPFDVEANITKQQAIVDQVNLLDATRLRYASWKHETRKWAFLIGLCSVIASRAYEPVIMIACSLGK